MPRQVHLFDPPERFVAGTVGQPGDRTFYLQARGDGRAVSVALEKAQVSLLAEKITELLEEVRRRGMDVPANPPPGLEDVAPLDVPLDEEFRVSALALGFEVGDSMVVIEAQAQSEGEPAELDDDSEEGPDTLRVRITPATALSFAARASRVVAAGRPPCPLCGLPLDPGRPHLPADERVPSLSEPSQDGLGADAAWTCSGQVSSRSRGRLVDASNATLFCAIASPTGAGAATCVYKPVRGERPLWDFPDGTLAGREYAAWLLSEATGWSVVPPTVLRDGPFGPGMVQWWVDVDESVDVEGLVRDGDPGLRRMALFDAVANNADRKGGHLLPVAGGHVYGCDHGLTFHEEDKLRTVLWAWRGTASTATRPPCSTDWRPGWPVMVTCAPSWRRT